MEVNTIKAGNKVHYDFIDEDGKHIIGEGVVIDVEHCDVCGYKIVDLITVKKNDGTSFGIDNNMITHIVN